MSTEHATQRKMEASNTTLEIFLRKQMIRSWLRALMVINEEGDLLWYCGDGVDPDRASALAPAIYHQNVAGPDSLTSKLWVDAIPLDHQTVYVFSLGEGDPGKVDHESTRKGIRSILEDRTP